MILAGALLIGLAVGGGMYLLTKPDEGPVPVPARAPRSPTHTPAPALTLDPNVPTGLAAVEAKLLRKPKRRQLAALALLYAVEGREDDLLRMLDASIRAGIDPDRVLDAIRELPRARQGAMLTAILARHPDLDADGHRMARIFEDSGDSVSALRTVRAALPNERGFDADLTRFLLHLDPKGAPAFLFGLEGASSWRGDDLQALVGFFVEFGRENEALAFVERALDEDPTDEDTLRVLARIAPDEAVGRLRAVVADDPANVSAWTRLGRLLRKQGDVGGAFEALQHAASRKPSRSVFEELLRADPHRALPLIVSWTKDASDDEAIGLLARAHMKAGQEREASEIFLRAHKSDPDDSEWIRGLIRVDATQAVTALEAQLAKTPSADVDLVGHYADALRAAGRTNESFDQYLAAHRKDPGGKDWQAGLAQVDPERALPVLKAFVEADPDDSSGQGAYGMALAAMGRTHEATRRLDRAIQRGDAGKWFDELAKIDPDRALSALRRRVRSDDRDDEIWGTLGKALARMGRAAEARTAFRRALALDPTSTRWADALRR